MRIIEEDGETKLVLEVDKEEVSRLKQKMIPLILSVVILPGTVLYDSSWDEVWWLVLVVWITLMPVIFALCISITGSSRSIILSQRGCMFNSWTKLVYLTWDEIVYRRYVCGNEGYSGCCTYSCNGKQVYPYEEGIIFSKHRKGEWRYWFAPGVQVNFYPKGISEGNGDYHSMLNTYKAAIGSKEKIKILRELRPPEVHAADRKEFLSYMALWGIEIENLSVIDRLDYGIKDYPSDKNN